MSTLLLTAAVLSAFGFAAWVSLRNISISVNISVNSPEPEAELLNPERFDVSKVKSGKLLTHIERAPSIEAGLSRWYLQRREPFIVHHPPEFRDATPQLLVRSLLRSNDSLRTSLDEESPAVYLSPTDVISRWRQGKVIRIIDAPISNLVQIPRLLSQYNGFEALTAGSSDANKDVSIQLTSSDFFSFVHHDPAESGGGWVYASDGEKHWVLFPPSYLPHATGELRKIMNHGAVPELESLSEQLLLAHADHKHDDMPFQDRIAPIHVVVMKKGDFLCWPPGWMHKVYTPKRFIGLGSYLLTPEDKLELAKGLGNAIKAARWED